MNYETIIQILKKNQCRLTPQRKVILKVLLSFQDSLVTIDDLLNLCQEKNPDINITTIYRNIELLDSFNLIYKKNINKNTTAYKIICSEHHHHHLTCLNCGKIVTIDYCPITPSLIELVESKDFTFTEHNLELFGYSSKCRK